MAIQAAMAEWLRRVIRNHLGSSRVGSNPARSVPFLLLFAVKFWPCEIGYFLLDPNRKFDRG